GMMTSVPSSSMSVSGQLPPSGAPDARAPDGSWASAPPPDRAMTSAIPAATTRRRTWNDPDRDADGASWVRARITGAVPFSRRSAHDPGPATGLPASGAGHRSGTVPDSHRLRGSRINVDVVVRRVYSA